MGPHVYWQRSAELGEAVPQLGMEQHLRSHCLRSMMSISLQYKVLQRGKHQLSRCLCKLSEAAAGGGD